MHQPSSLHGKHIRVVMEISLTGLSVDVLRLEIPGLENGDGEVVLGRVVREAHH